jgi:hypothetical protein
MNGSITVSLPDHILKRARLLAKNSRRPVEEILAQTIELSLDPLCDSADSERAITEWTNADVLQATKCRMSRADSRRLSRLLDRQQTGELASEERRELAALVQVYQTLLLRKAQALSEAVRRGLRRRLKP